MADNKLPSGIDRVVGQRIRWRRKELKLTQEKLGELLAAYVAEDGDAIHAPVMTSEILDLIAAFQKIEDQSLRKSLLGTIQAAATAFDGKQQDED
ncbi:unnamed protein product [Laminaria digitata]